MEIDQIQISCSNFLLLMLDLLKTYDIKPIFVFDGRSLNLKGDTIAKRKNVRESNKNKITEMMEKKKK